jgi:hypothetical protein
MTTTIPAELRPIVFGALIEAFRGAVESVERYVLNPDSRREALARFDAIRAALDSIGWGEHADLDLDAHRDVFQSALAERLSAERAMLADALETEAGHKDAGVASQRAYGYTMQLEAFMHEAGFTIPQEGEQARRQDIEREEGED